MQRHHKQVGGGPLKRGTRRLLTVLGVGALTGLALAMLAFVFWPGPSSETRAVLAARFQDHGAGGAPWPDRRAEPSPIVDDLAAGEVDLDPLSDWIEVAGTGSVTGGISQSWQAWGERDPAE